MPDNTYPRFESGQTLTATDLNLLPAFLHERDRLVGRMIGFGINGGLAGTVSGTTLTIAPGLAVDQHGEPLVLGTAQAISLPPTPVTPTYDFIDTGPGGFSVVLEAAETVEPAPACGEADCAGHAEHHTKSVVLRVVSGRVTGTRFDFAAEPLLAREPVRVGLDSSPITSFNDLRTAVADELDNPDGPPLVAPALITKLRGVTIGSGDSPAVRGYKCGWLNMVFFATLDLLRCEALVRLLVDRTVARPGVVVGWVRQTSTGWAFDCAWRHAWEPPRGFTEAFLGGTCTDPCSTARDLVESLIDGYAPPDPPPPAAEPEPPDIVCPKGWIRVGGTCRRVVVPPQEVFDWKKWWLRELSPLDPVWNPPLEEPEWLRNPEVVYGQPAVTLYGEEVIGGLQYVGYPAVDGGNRKGVATVLTEHITAQGGVADVRVVSHAEALTMPGFQPSSVFSGSDVVVLVADQAGTVVGTGRVPAAVNARQVSTALPKAQAAAAEATQAVQQAGQLVTGIRSKVTALETQVSALGDQFGQIQVDLDQRDRIASLEGQVQVISRTGGVKGLTPGYGRGLAEFTETTLAAMKALESQNPQLRRYATDVERKQAQFEVDVASGDPEVIGVSALNLIKSMRTMVKSSLKGVPEGATLGSQLDAQVRNLERLFG